MKIIPSIDLPEKMKALILSAYDGNPQLKEVIIPRPQKGEVLIQIDSSPINPSDYSFINGRYHTKKNLPVIPGFEASGIVVATGDDFMSKRLLGKSIACFAPQDGNGTWAEYMVTKNNMVIPLKKGVDLEQGSMLLVNPMSVLAMLEIVKKGRHKAIANTAAASALGQMLNKVCMENNIPIVNIVRREEQEVSLKVQGAKYIINSSLDDFPEALSEVFAKLKVTLAFDAISGQMTTDLLEALPDGGEVTVYGNLSEEPASVLSKHLIFEKKKVSGFWLSAWIAKQALLKLLYTFNKVQKYLSKKHQFKINKRVSLEETVEGISLYYNKMSDGKVLVKPGIS